MIFLCYEKCSTCQKAKKWLDENKSAYEVRPMIITEELVIPGFKEEEWKEALL